MPCLIAAEIIWFAILKVFKETWQVAVLAVACFAAGMVLFDHGILNRFMINRALTAQVFLLIGWLIRKYERPIMERAGKVWNLVAGAGVYFALGVLSLVLYPGEVMDVHLCKYYNHAICQLMIWTGICTLFILAAKYIRKYPRWWVLTLVPVTVNSDDRGSFTELVRTPDRGQVSINISKPGITKGQHWHDCKNEIFIVVKGHGLIQMRNLKDNEIEEYEVSGDHIQGVWMKPGWTHNIINLSDTEDLVTVMWASEMLDKNRPDTFFEKV